MGWGPGGAARPKRRRALSEACGCGRSSGAEIGSHRQSIRAKVANVLGRSSGRRQRAPRSPEPSLAKRALCDVWRRRLELETRVSDRWEAADLRSNDRRWKIGERRADRHPQAAPWHRLSVASSAADQTADRRAERGGLFESAQHVEHRPLGRFADARPARSRPLCCCAGAYPASSQE